MDGAAEIGIHEGGEAVSDSSNYPDLSTVVARDRYSSDYRHLLFQPGTTFSEVFPKPVIEGIKTAFEGADWFYFDISAGPLGDAIVATAYFKAFQEAVRKQGRKTPITLIVNKGYRYLLGNYNDDPDLSIMPVDAASGLEGARSDSFYSDDVKNPLYVDFSYYNDRMPYFEERDYQGRHINVLGGLLGLGVEGYDNLEYLDRRYSRCVEDLLDLPIDSLDPNNAQPTVELPIDSEETYQKVREKFAISDDRPQVSIVIEASALGKRYPLGHWGEVVKQIKQQHPDYQFNFIYNPNSNVEGYQERDLQKIITEQGLQDDCHMVSGNLAELASLIKHQKLVLTNDTGLAHIAGGLKNGPKTLIVFAPSGAPRPEMWLSSKNQYAISLPPEQANVLPNVNVFEEKDEQNKYISKISPASVASKALTLI